MLNMYIILCCMQWVVFELMFFPFRTMQKNKYFVNRIEKMTDLF